MGFINGQLKCAGSGSCQGPPCSACTTSEGCQSDSIPAGETRLSGSFQCPLDSIPKLERLHFHSPDGSTLIATTFNQATPSSSQVNYPAASSSGAVSCFLVDTAGGTPIGAATPNPLVDNSIRVSFTCKNVFQACPVSGAISFSCINPCETFLTCSTCKAAANCGWCQTSGQCLYGSSNGAYSNTSCKASANNWLYTNAQTCPSTVVKRDGGWGGWSSCFSDCKQVRTCNNPTPANGGSTCLGAGEQPCMGDFCVGTTPMPVPTSTLAPTSTVSPSGTDPQPVVSGTAGGQQLQRGVLVLIISTLAVMYATLRF